MDQPDRVQAREAVGDVGTDLALELLLRPWSLIFAIKQEQDDRVIDLPIFLNSVRGTLLRHQD